MLRAYANTPIDEFIAQLRTYVIAMGLSQAVVDCVDQLADRDRLENEHAVQLENAEEDGYARGAEETKNRILTAVNTWLERQSNYDLIAVPCEAIIKQIEEA